MASLSFYREAGGSQLYFLIRGRLASYDFLNQEGVVLRAGEGGLFCPQERVICWRLGKKESHSRERIGWETVK